MEWISVNDQLPPENEFVLILLGPEHEHMDGDYECLIEVAYLSDNWWVTPTYIRKINEVTDWMSMPELPD